MSTNGKPSKKSASTLHRYTFKHTENDQVSYVQSPWISLTYEELKERGAWPLMIGTINWDVVEIVKMEEKKVYYDL